MSELKPCPFCGNKEVTLWPMPDGGDKWLSPFCENCGATHMETVTGEDTKASIAAWNRRTPAPEVEALRDVIRNADPVLNELGEFISFIADQVKGGGKIHVIDSRVKLKVLVDAFKTLDQVKWNAALTAHPAAPSAPKENS